MHYCETNDILSQHQFDFRKQNGTDTAIAIAYEKIAVNQKNKNHCNVICRDVAKAFNHVWIEALQCKIISQEELPDLLKKITCSFTNKCHYQTNIPTTIRGATRQHTLIITVHIFLPMIFLCHIPT